MSSRRVAARYAKSLFQLARDTGVLEEVFADTSLISQTFYANRNLRLMLLNPVIRYDFKLRILQRVFQREISQLSSRFLELLSRKGRAELLPEICIAFTGFYHEEKGMVAAEVTGSVSLDDKMRAELSEYVRTKTGKNVLLEEKIDGDLIGGFVLRVGDLQLDRSVSGMLRQLKRELHETKKRSSKTK